MLFHHDPVSESLEIRHTDTSMYVCMDGSTRYALISIEKPTSVFNQSNDETLFPRIGNAFRSYGLCGKMTE